MDQDLFITCLIEQFDDCITENVTKETRFRELDGWSSYTALSIMAVVDEEYGVQLTADEMRSAETFEELFNLVINKQ